MVVMKILKLNLKQLGVTRNYKIDFEGIISFIENQYKNAESTSIKRWAKDFMDEVTCSTCDGKRLKKEALHFKIIDKNISDLAQMDITELAEWFKNIEENFIRKTTKNCC